MKSLQSTAIVLLLSTVLVSSSFVFQEALATDESTMSKMIQVDSKITKLKEMDMIEDEFSMGSVSFEMNQIKDLLLEINDANDKNHDRLDVIYSYLKDNYSEILNQYEDEVKKYQDENGLTAQEKKLVSQVLKAKSVFTVEEQRQDSAKEQVKLIKTAIKETKAKEDYQKLVNKIGEKLANDANGGEVENIHHKIAIKEITKEKDWVIAAPAIDRIIKQTNSEEAKAKLYEIKGKIKELLEKKEKQNQGGQILTLSSNAKQDIFKSIQFNPNEIAFGGVLERMFEDEIESSLAEIDKIVEKFEIQNVIEPIIEDQISNALEDAVVIIEEDDADVQNEIKKQRLDAAKNSNNGKHLGNDNPNKGKGNNSGGGQDNNNGKAKDKKD